LYLARRNFLTGQRFEETIYGKEVVFLYKFSYYYSLLSSGFKPLKIEANQWFLIKNTDGIRYYIHKERLVYQFEYSFYRKFIYWFQRSTRFKESEKTNTKNQFSVI
jgi:hypothetical protein